MAVLGRDRGAGDQPPTGPFLHEGVQVVLNEDVAVRRPEDHRARRGDSDGLELAVLDYWEILPEGLSCLREEYDFLNVGGPLDHSSSSRPLYLSGGPRFLCRSLRSRCSLRISLSR